jgi:hypothetical protein
LVDNPAVDLGGLIFPHLLQFPLRRAAPFAALILAAIWS